MKKVIGSTESICPECLLLIPAKILTDDRSVFLRKVCPVHGEFIGLIWSDLHLYERACGQQNSYALPEALSQKSIFHYGLYDEAARRPCLIILDITQQCNTNCPMCIADTPSHRGIPPRTVDQIKENLEALQSEVINRFSMQLSGGEPTLYEELISLLKMMRTQGFGR